MYHADVYTFQEITCSILDGCAIWLVIDYPSSGSVQDLVLKFRAYIEHKLTSSDAYIVFNICNELSTKNVTRSESTCKVVQNYEHGKLISSPKLLCYHHKRLSCQYSC